MHLKSELQNYKTVHLKCEYKQCILNVNTNLQTMRLQSELQAEHLKSCFNLNLITNSPS